MNINIHDLQKKYMMESRSVQSHPEYAPISDTANDIASKIQSLHDQFMPLIADAVKSMVVTNCMSQKKAHKTDFYIARLSRNFFEYQEIEDNVSNKKVIIDFDKKTATKNGSPFALETLRLFTKNIFKKLSQDITHEVADVLEEDFKSEK